MRKIVLEACIVVGFVATSAACGGASDAPPAKAPLPQASATPPAVTAEAAPTPPPPPSDPVLGLLDTLARFAPEQISGLGLPGHEDDISDFMPDVSRRTRLALLEAGKRLEDAEAAENDPAKKEDLAIARGAAKKFARQQEIGDTRFLPYSDVGRTMFMGLMTHLRPGGKTEHALVRLKKYAGNSGAAPGAAGAKASVVPPILVLAQARTEERLATPGLLFPTKTEVEQHLANLPVYVNEIEEVFKKRGVVGYEAPLALLKKQAEAYAAFVRAKVLPNARTDFKLPADVYDFELHDMTGVDIPRAELEQRAHAAYEKTKKEMDTLAPVVAKEKKLKAKGYREVLRELKKDQASGDALVTLYKKRVEEIEAITKREKLVTLPEHPMSFRLATAAETAENPSPTIDVQALFKKDAPLDFLMPVAPPSRPGDPPGSLAYEDFTFASGSWTIAAHEARPGHELQFTRMKEKGISIARTLFAFNSVNVEGWGLYSEALIYPFMPKDAELAALRMRALREARAFLDPELHEGKITVDDAKKLLADELCFSDGVIRQEIDRYTFGSPTQATAYFYGAQRLAELRKDTEKAMGSRFDARAFHDFILAEGLVTPDLLRQAVNTRFVPAH